MEQVINILNSLFLLITMSCQTDDASNIEALRESTQDLENEISVYDSLYNQTALFLAGKPSKQFKTLQSHFFYKNYKQQIDKYWNIATTNNLAEINKWRQNNPYPKTDSLTLLYPFSGPDFLYANAFFPNANNYILIGLEKSGSMPRLNNMTQKQISKYLSNLLHSMRYVSKAGFFVTEQMQNDLSRSQLDGVSHLLLFYLAKTNYKVLDVSSIQINHFGDIRQKNDSINDDEFINGLCFKILSLENKKKNLYYFPLDLSDNNLKNEIGFMTFLSKMGKKNVFIKSASYLLHNKHFSVSRDIILKQSETIVQDDTGISYSILSTSGFSIKLFGKYQPNVNIFKEFFQKDLFQEANKDDVPDLNFNIGYNSLKKRMLILLATSGAPKVKKKPLANKKAKKGIVFKVQIQSSWHKIPIDDEMFADLPKVEYYKSEHSYKYTIGNFSTYEECEEYVEKARKKGFKGAFIVAFNNNKRISLKEANKGKL